jgi:hypothetical protein
MSQSLYIMQQQPTKLHLHGNRIRWIGHILLVLPCTLYGVWSSYTSSRVMQLECNPGGRPTPCHIMIWRQTMTPNELETTIESIQSASIREETPDGNIIYKLWLTTPHQTFEFPDVASDAAQSAAQTINTFNQQAQSEAFKLEYSNQRSNNGWAIFWSCFTCGLIFWLLFTPISVDWRFDTETGWLSANCRYIFWRHQYRKPLSQIQAIDWITHVHNDYDSSHTSYRIDLTTRSGIPISLDPKTITRPGIPISLVPSGWPEDWSRADSEPVVAAISQILKLPMPRAASPNILKGIGQ